MGKRLRRMSELGLRTNESSKHRGKDDDKSVVNETKTSENRINFPEVNQETSDVGEKPSEAFNQLGFIAKRTKLQESIYEPIGYFIPRKLNENVWSNEFVDFNILIKSPRDFFTRNGEEML